MSNDGSSWQKIVGLVLMVAGIGVGFTDLNWQGSITLLVAGYAVYKG
jgi:hypothetical protein